MAYWPNQALYIQNPIIPYGGCNRTLRKRARMELTIPNADIVIEAEVTSEGRIYGLKKYAGRTVKIVVLEERRKK